MSKAKKFFGKCWGGFKSGVGTVCGWGIKIPSKLWRTAKRSWGKLEKAVIFLLLACGAVSVGWYLYCCQQWQAQLAGAGFGLWVVICVAKGFVGTITRAQGLLIKFGNAVKAVGPGWYPVFYPLERIWKIPTSQYPPLVYQVKRRIYAKAGRGLSTQLLEVVEISIYLQLPIAGKTYHIFDTAGALVAISGEQLLMDYFYPRQPVRNLFGIRAWRKWQEHFEPVVMGIAGNVLSGKTTKECNEDRAIIAGQIKDGLFSVVGNPFYTCGIPFECVGVVLTRVKLLDEIDQADIRVQVARQGAKTATLDAEGVEVLKTAGVSSSKAYDSITRGRSAPAPSATVAPPQQTPQPAQPQVATQESWSESAAVYTVFGFLIFGAVLFFVGFFIYKMAV